MTRFFQIRFQLSVVITLFAFVGPSQCQAPLAHLVATDVHSEDNIDNRELDLECPAKKVVTFRLEVGANEPIDLLASGPMGSAPMTFRSAGSGETSRTEPRSNRSFSGRARIRRLKEKVRAQWIPLPPSSVYQWQANLCAVPAEDQPFSVLIRDSKSRAPIAIVGSW